MFFAGGARRRPATAVAKAIPRAVAGALALLALGQPAAATVRCDWERWNTGQWARAVWNLETQGVVLVTGRIMRADLIEPGTVQIDDADAPADAARLRLTMTVDEWLVGGDAASPTEITILTTQIDGSRCSAFLDIGIIQNLVLTRTEEGDFVLSRRGSLVPTWGWDDVQAIAGLYRAQQRPEAGAEDPDPDHQGVYAHHIAEMHGVTISHAWGNATEGDTAHVYLDLSVAGGVRALLRGASAGVARDAVLVRTHLEDGEVSERPNSLAFVTDGGETDYLLPYGPSFLLSGLERPLVEGEVLDLVLHLVVRRLLTDPEEIAAARRERDINPLVRVVFSAPEVIDIPISVDVLAPDAMDHPHAVRSPWGW